MLFGGIQKFSLCDYPGRTAAVLFTQGCNFRCPFCHNGSLLPSKNPEQEQTEEKICSFLEQRSGQLDGVVISGGEPTLQAGLAAFCRRVRELGFRIKLDTNGSRPGVLQRLLKDALVDYIAMDIKATLGRYPILAGVPVETGLIGKSIELLAEADIPVLFRTTWVEGLHLPEERDLIPAMIQKRKNSRHVFQPFTPEHALEPERCRRKKT